MGFQKPNLDAARQIIGVSLHEIRSPYNDGFTACYCKHDLYLLKYWLDEEYKQLPKFAEEDEWEKQRLITTLQQ
jgi:hypothetical protein